MLEEVEAQLAEDRGDREERKVERHRIVDEVKAAFDEEAAEIVEHDRVELTRKIVVPLPGVSSAEEDSTGTESKEPRGGVEERHRFEKSKPRRSASRVITLRDRRRGSAWRRRRWKKRRKKKGGSEPPD